MDFWSDIFADNLQALSLRIVLCSYDNPALSPTLYVVVLNAVFNVLELLFKSLLTIELAHLA